MALFADFGDKEHVFSPVSHLSTVVVKADDQVRRKYKEWTTDMTTLSPGERSILGLDKPLRSDLESKSEKRPS